MDGNYSDPHFPFRVILEPTPLMREESSSWIVCQIEPCTTGSEYFEEMATTILTIPLRYGPDDLPDNTVWYVLAEAYPGAPQQQIGKIEITDSFRPSLWADNCMFFRH